MDKLLIPSENETEILGFKVARCNVPILDEEVLKQELIKDEYDFCRLKLSAEDENISLKLSKIGFPFYFSGSIRRYKTRITERDRGIIEHGTLLFEEYNGTQFNLLKEMLKGTWGSYPLGYYRTPFLTTLVDKEIELESVFNFYRHSNLRFNNPNNTIMFMKDKGRYVGFFALNKINETLESHIGGILEPYRRDGYFLDMLIFIKNYCLDNNLSHFAFGARNENAEVQRIFQHVGFQPTGTENVFHILPFLTHSQKPIISEKVKFKTAFFSFLSEYIYERFSKKGIRHINLVNHKRLITSKEYHLELTTPVINQNEMLLTLKIKEKEELISIAYIVLN